MVSGCCVCSVSGMLGCCFDSLVGMASLGGSNSAMILKQWTNNQCGIQTPASCADAALDGTWVVDNSSPSWVSNSSNLAVLRQSIAKDIETNAGTNLNVAITNNVVSYHTALMSNNQLQDAARVTVNFRGLPTQGVDAAPAQAKLSRRVSSGKAGLTATNNVVGVRGRVGTGVTLNTAMSSTKVTAVAVETPKTSSAARIGASAVVIVAVVIALLF
eukprot:TRINITY_DN11600_c0_g1_i5.p1 TRINITY_DN11600_c0_g1~~TRINITY_DN11600_c0_g1_i5.p1  ORF type:complete len:216 (-),score=85.16 TRINITY_DN11600_c0_g1_i5:73-720(-)